ncbi:MAG: hypothetical protein LBT70_00985 [Holosporaceae bacterium]|jgi:hypothetical protein|nr:hypothetical protein [Holosporaceae bacterium]
MKKILLLLIALPFGFMSSGYCVLPAAIMQRQAVTNELLNAIGGNAEDLVKIDKGIVTLDYNNNFLKPFNEIIDIIGRMEWVWALSIRNNNDLQILPNLPQNLENLRLGNCQNLTTLPNEFPPKLKRLFLENCPNLGENELDNIPPSCCYIVK